VFTEFVTQAQWFFSSAPHNQQKLLMRKNACIVDLNGHLIFKADASYSDTEAHKSGREHA
jgi:hypothetical protein